MTTDISRPARKRRSIKAANGQDDDQVVAVLGERIKVLRTEAGLTLDQLAERSGVSRAMLSKVERGEKSPTLAIMARISRGLNITISALLGEHHTTAAISHIPKAKRVVFTDRETGFERHLLFPIDVDHGIELLMHLIPPGISSGAPPVYKTLTAKYLIVQEGTLTVYVGTSKYILEAGDAFYFEIKESYQFVNEGSEPCSYYMAIVSERQRRDGAIT